MPISIKAFIFVTVMVMLSVFVTNLSNLITVEIGDEADDSDLSDFTTKLSEGQDQEEDDNLVLQTVGDSTEHLIWFLQISDIHISIFHDPDRVTELKEFCDITVSAINPSVVLASGDLTDAKTADNMGSRQYIEEWKIYKDLLNECRVINKTIWLDIRGNHDNFNVASSKSKENYYRNYSVQGELHPKSYLYQIKQGGETYSFIAVDACLEPGPRRPFNFVGVLSNKETTFLSRLVEESRKNGGDYIIWFGHYPTSCILSPSKGGIRSIIGKHPEGLAYLCGHFHMLGGAVPKMYTLQRYGFLELELGDWKDNRMFRLMAVDHGLFSFTDIHHRSWPAVLITNPKNALYKMPGREPLKKINLSTHIRILAFSVSPLTVVKVRINNNKWTVCRHVSGPLYVAPWNPNHYLAGLHDIHVFVKDEAGRELLVTQPFSLDGSRLSFGLLPRILLMCNLSMLFQFMFGSMLLFCIIPLCVLKCLHKMVIGNKIARPRISSRFFRWFVRKLWILASVDRLFYPLVVYPLYLTVGPWSIGEVIEDHTGIIFAWGTIINGQYLPGSFTYLYGFVQMCTFQFPLTFMLATAVERKFALLFKEKSVTKIRRVCQDFPFVLIIVLQMILAYFFWLAYGTMAFVLGPLRTWSAFLAAFLWYQVANLPDKCFRESVKVWCTGPLKQLDHQTAEGRYNVPADNDCTSL